MLLLHLLFVGGRQEGNPPKPGRDTILSALVVGGGDWGVRLAHALFAASAVPTAWKIAALQGLHKAGVVRPDQPVPMVIDGHPQDILLRAARLVLTPDPTLEPIRQRARALLAAGQPEAARQALDEFVHGELVYAPAVATYAAILWRQGKRDEARRWLRLFHPDTAPHDPATRATLAAVLAEEAPEFARMVEDEVAPSAGAEGERPNGPCREQGD